MTEGSLDTPDDLHRVAAEFALSLLSEPERDVAERRYETDPEFRASVDRWRGHFSGFVDELTPRQPSAAVWRALESQIGTSTAGQGDPVPVTWWNHLELWRTAALAGMVATAAAVAVALLPPAGERAVPRDLTPPLAAASGALGATLLPKDGPALFVVTHDPGSSRLVAVPTGQPVQNAGSYVLWLLRGDDDPVVVGTIARERPTQIDLSPSLVALLGGGTILVVTEEPAGAAAGSQTSPGPVIAKGVLEQAQAGL